MRTEAPRPVYLSDYRPPDYLIDKVSLDFRLAPETTRVTSRLSVRPNPQGRPDAPLVLDGEDLTLISITLDGTALAGEDVSTEGGRLTLRRPPARPFTLEIVTQIDPAANTQLMGLYRSNDVYCTQCEAEGFRRITYFLDRPDVLSVYTTRIEARKGEAPVLLANGNLVESGEVPGTDRHFAVWHDPFPKPAYLFALVGGDLAHVEDTFRTVSGRDVALKIYIEPGSEDRCAYALDALKRSMRWDEEAFGREYDLDIFMIVAVSHFNMGAMENKGLNIFNDKYVLARPDTATDADYANIEGIIAHEYFHNWTGNRITCRDWFQLCLKEGLTVFRDQEFSADMRSRPVKRITDVRALRAQQFAEDAGPLAHPVRPEKYSEINNFYTATVYEKGAEVIRMLKVLIGDEAFRAGMDLYFGRHDGEAATIEQFLACFAETSGRDLGQFALWYSQAGTPEIAMSGRYDATARSFTLSFEQTCPATPGQPDKAPMVIPVAYGLVGENGPAVPARVQTDAEHRDGLIVMTGRRHTVTFEGLDARPIPSLLRGFSAPVRMTMPLGSDELATLMARDEDPFNRWQASQTLVLRDLIATCRPGGGAASQDEVFADAVAAMLEDQALEPAFLAQILALPSEADIAREIGSDVDPDAVHAVREAKRAFLGERLSAPLLAMHERHADTGAYSPDADGAGRRSLAAATLDLLAATGDAGHLARVSARYEHADNMTDRMAALAILVRRPDEAREKALADFFARYRNDHLVLDKWFALQASAPGRETLDRVTALMTHPAFSLANPNRVRALVGVFAMANQAEFNRPDGKGYDFLVDTVLTLDPRNPQVAARLLSAFRSWRALEAGRRGLVEKALRRVLESGSLSPDLRDIAERSLQ